LLAAWQTTSWSAALKSNGIHAAAGELMGARWRGAAGI
jgi:hypothetical protein